MAQYDKGRNAGAGRSRARGSSRAGSRGGRSSSGTGAGRSNYTRNSTSGGRKRPNGRKEGLGFGKIAIGGVVLILAIACIVFLVKGMGGLGSGESETESTAPTETELQKEVIVDGVNITGMSRDEAKAAILEQFGWAMTVVWEDQTYEVTDLMSGKVDALLAEIYAGEPKESYSLDTDGLEDAVTAEAAAVAQLWDKKARNGSISGYDKETGKFTFAEAESGLAVDQELLKSDMLQALRDKDFDAQIQAAVNTVEAEISAAAAKEQYQTISSVTTNTTANSKRNTNVRLACEAINGTVLQPGEEFSFNKVVGERTEAKGYKGAAAYNNGEVVEEIGGGVCQVSSTLYNAVVKAGLKTTVRRSHTFEPSYVTPGTDATISWGGPDYCFVNNSSTAIGIRSSYSDQKCTVSIYGIPILEEGVTYSLKSTKIKDIDPPAPTYEEDGTLQPGEEKVKSSGSKGSYWETRLVITKDGEVISQEIDHTVTYKGHAPVILRNTSGTVAPGAETTDPNETIIDPNTQTGEGQGTAPTESQDASNGEGPGGGPGVSGGPGSEQTPASNPNTAVSPTPGASQGPAQPTTAPASPAPTAPSASAPASAPTAGPGSDSGNPNLIAPMPGA
ncbi:MAG TPA: VanW family protein [Candidatus Ventrimonas merdavium]|nr:VanW family protein [Candidatus Ventrimonas merdavium]